MCTFTQHAQENGISCVCYSDMHTKSTFLVHVIPTLPFQASTSLLQHHLKHLFEINLIAVHKQNMFLGKILCC